MEEKDIRFRKLERKTGIFLLIAALLIALSIISIGIRREVFTAKVNIFFSDNTGDNLTVGQAVKFKGFRIGKVTSVKLNEDSKVGVEMTILKDYARFVRKDSLASLSQEGLIGDYMIEIKGGGTGPAVEEGDIITFERALSLGSIAADVQSQLDTIIEEIKEATAKVTDPDGHLLKTIENIRVLSDELILTNRSVRQLIVTSEKLVKSINENMVPELERTLAAAGDMMSDETSKRINDALDNVVAVTEDIKSATSQIPGVISDTKDITESIKDVWPISSNIEEAQEGVLGIDSQR